MSASECDSDQQRDSGDDALRRAISALPMPSPPPGLESQVRRHFRRRLNRRRISAAVSGLIVVAASLIWHPWTRHDPPGRSPDQFVPLVKSEFDQHEIPARELDLLFAPPPVDSFAILSRQHTLMVLALGRLEVSK